jgi:GrpB-like predicted nucleotidyltransferase (UPF0157 family)
MAEHHIEIAAYDPGWPGRFASEEGRLAAPLAPWAVGPIEHVGSTAVPGLCAKPVIDIMVPVADLASSRPAIPILEGLDYLYWPYKAELMHWLCRPSPTVRTHHIHLIPADSQLFRDRLAFRDALRADRRLRDEYAALKRELARQHRTDREAYTEAKGPFVERVLERAGG